MRFSFPGGSMIALLVIVGTTLVTVGTTACSSPGTAMPGSPVAANTPTTSASAVGDGAPPGLPPMKRFRIGGEGYGPVQDCALGTGDAVTCTASWDDPYQADTYTGGFTGTLSGWEMTGTSTTSQTGRDAADPECRWQVQTTTRVTYSFDPRGTVTAQYGPGEWRKTGSGSCSGTETGSDPGGGESGPVAWAVIE